MVPISFDAKVSDDERRQRLYAGEIFIYSPTAAGNALCDFAREMTAAAFRPLDPRTAQHSLPVERFAAILAELKPAFIHHPESKRLIRELLAAVGCDPNVTYFDVPRLRTSTSHAFLTTGIAYAFHPHRDTWYSAPPCQLNWWLPLHDLSADDGLGFHPSYWSRGVRNGSRRYNYAEWNRTSRHTAAVQIGEDTRDQPKPEEPMDVEAEIRPLCAPGGLVIFSAAQMHSSVPNTSGRTRLSVDFRTVNVRDVEEERGAANVDSECTGTTMGDYLRCRDLEHIPRALVERYEKGILAVSRPGPLSRR
ncbi:MAG TPA: phytanoyl-CoA dioxygenase family protein [Myxococcota bacterium]|nr:phytanoyl-CoA dioxygenase family protein [Myxococcota bacterium]